MRTFSSIIFRFFFVFHLSSVCFFLLSFHFIYGNGAQTSERQINQNYLLRKINDFSSFNLMVYFTCDSNSRHFHLIHFPLTSNINNKQTLTMHFAFRFYFRFLSLLQNADYFISSFFLLFKFRQFHSGKSDHDS